MKIKHFRELDVYQNALKAAMEIFEISKRFPNEERFSLTDQVRRSSRSVCANISEAWRKRRYAAAFVSKLNDAEGEAAETQVHIEVASLSGYLDRASFQRLDDIYDKIIGQLVNMAEHPEKWTTH
ncbi:MAG: four helix bundle protein [Candidatus Udaeobacter sp.]